MLTAKQKAWCEAHKGPKPKVRKGPTFGDIFVAIEPDGFLCQECVLTLSIDAGSDAVQVWEVGSAGWIGPCICSSCKLSIPVVVDGAECRVCNGAGCEDCE